MKTNIKTMAALLIASATFVACSNDNDIISETMQSANQTDKYTMTINAVKGEDATTRALSLEGNTLYVKWAATDQVAVYKDDWTATLGMLTAAASDNGSTILTGELDAAPTANNTIHLLSPRATWDYTGQTGVLLGDENSIEKKYDYALADVTVDAVMGNKVITTKDANFASQQAIVKFTLQDASGNDLPVTSLNISTDGGKLVQSRAYTDGGWIPSACEEYNDNSYPYYFYLELPFQPVSIRALNFSEDNNFGSGGHKEADGKYIYLLKSNSEPEASIRIIAMGDDYLDAEVTFTNGAYYTYVNDVSASMTIPQYIAPGHQSTYGSLNVTHESTTNTLTVALCNDLDGADTYTLIATDGSNVYSFVKSGVNFENGKYYEITVKMMPGVPLAHATAGMVVGTDGKAYNVNYYPSGVTAAGVVVYNSDSHGLVLALKDETNTMTQTAAMGENGAAAHEPAVPGYSWRLPSVQEWETIMKAYSTVLEVISEAEEDGQTLKLEAKYWTSDSKYIVYLSEYDGIFRAGSMYSDTNPAYNIRVCFEF